MSKYRICIGGNSLLLTIVEACWLALVLFSIWCWQDNVITQQIWIQTLLSVSIIVVSGSLRLRDVKSGRQQIVLLTDSGELQFMPEDGMEWLVTSESRLAGPLVFLHKVDRFDDTVTRGQWLAKDQFADADFRRVCRVICRCQRMQQLSDCNSSAPL